MKLIDNWRGSLRLFSMQALLAVGALQTTLAALPPEALAAVVPGTTTTWGSVIVALSVIAAGLGALGRVIDQSAPPAQ